MMSKKARENKRAKERKKAKIAEKKENGTFVYKPNARQRARLADKVSSTPQRTAEDVVKELFPSSLHHEDDIMPGDVTTSTYHELWPAAYLGGGGPGANRPDEVALIVLNSPITSYNYLRQLSKHASLRIYADGGANRVYAAVRGTGFRDGVLSDMQEIRPSLIHGDLDSLLPHVRDAFEAIGVEVSKDPDQYSTDFGKAVKQVMQRMPGVRDILVLGSLGGRVDQGLGLLGELYREQKIKHSSVRFWLFSEASVTSLLTPGVSTLHTPVKEGLTTRNTGILPLYGPSVITTRGFEWDVKDWNTAMGGNVSTSNHIVADTVTVETSNDVLFTVERAVKE